ncbi:MAG: aminotransferase class I/II-fold pyridoxal phosphate-dependent enzyme [Parvularculaceae bacterium]
MTAPTPRPGILDIAPYVPGASKAAGAAKVYKLSSNESALGASAKAVEAYRNCAASLHHYPTARRRRCAKRSARFLISIRRVSFAARARTSCCSFCRAYVGEGDNVIQSQYGFLVYAIATKSCGGEIRFAPEEKYVTDVDAILKLVDDKTRIVFIANPNNPTGTYIPDTEVRRLRAGLRRRYSPCSMRPTRNIWMRRTMTRAARLSTSSTMS